MVDIHGLVSYHSILNYLLTGTHKYHRSHRKLSPVGTRPSWLLASQFHRLIVVCRVPWICLRGAQKIKNIHYRFPKWWGSIGKIKNHLKQTQGTLRLATPCRKEHLKLSRSARDCREAAPEILFCVPVCQLNPRN